MPPDDLVMHATSGRKRTSGHSTGPAKPYSMLSEVINHLLAGRMARATGRKGRAPEVRVDEAVVEQEVGAWPDCPAAAEPVASVSDRD